MRRLYSTMLYAVMGALASPALPTQAAEPEHLLPSEVSELQYVYNSLRTAAREGNVEAYTAFHDPTEMTRMTTAPDGARIAISSEWLQSHAREWPGIDAWEFIDMRKTGNWARLVLRHPHATRDPERAHRWDLYLLVFRHVDDTWRLTRRAIITASARGDVPPTAADLALPDSYSLPPR